MRDDDDYHRSGLADVVSRVKSMIVRGTVRKVDDGPKMQTVDLQLEEGMRATKVEHFHPYGVSYKPREGSEVVVASLSGNRDHMIAFPVGDRRYRIKVEDGEVALHDDQGQKVHLTREGVKVVTPYKADVDAQGDVKVKSAGRVDIEAPTIKLKGAIEIEGDINQVGKITSTGPHAAAGHV